MKLQIPAGSEEYILAELIGTDDDGTVIDWSDASGAVAIVARGTVPEESDYQAGAVVDVTRNNRRMQAVKVKVGVAPFALSAGLYDVWARASTADEAPRREVGALEIT